MADVDWASELLGPSVAAQPDGVQLATDWGSELLGPSVAQPRDQPEPAQPASSKFAEPDASSWIGRRAQDVLGKRDARYQGIPTVAQALKSEGQMGFGNALRESGAWLTGASDKDMAGVYRGMLGERFIRDETDANGYPVIVYRGKDGKEAKAYVNAPGLDLQDVMRGVEGIAPYIGSGRLVSHAMKGSAAVPRMVGQAIGQGATSVAQDAAGVAAGVSDPDPERSVAKAGVAAAGGAAGELIGQGLGYAWRALVSEPRFFNRATGQLTPAGEDAARAAGIDPATLPSDVAQSFGRAMADTGDPAKAITQSTMGEFKIPRTVGEVTGSKQKLLREQQMEGGAFGDRAAGRMKDFRARQDEAIQNAARGDIAPGQPGIAGQLAPDRAGARLGKDELGANIRSNTESAYEAAKKIENTAWKAVPDDFRANEAALAAIDDVIPRALAKRQVKVIEEGLTPAAKKMSDMIERFQAGEMPTTASKYVSRDLAGHVDIMRRRLLAGMEDAVTDTDKRAAKALYEGFNDWIVEAAKLSGDPSIATKLTTARGITREVHEFFDGPQGTAGARIMANVLKKADSAEGVVNALFSAPARSEIKGGAIQALDSLKKAYDKFLPPEAAKAAWDDVRLAYWMRIAEVKTGDVAGVKAFASSIKTAVNNQSSLARKLYTPQEIAKMNRLANILDDVARRNPNTSWSGVSIGGLLRDVGNAVVTMLGGNSIFMRTAVDTALRPVAGGFGAAQARAATGAGVGAAVPRLPPPSAIGGVGGGIGGQSQRK